MNPTEPLLLLAPPHQIALPALDRGRRAVCHTLARAQARWPAIVAAGSGDDLEAALRAMEQLAHEMWEATPQDPEPWWPALTLARRTLYEDMCVLAVYHGLPHAADAGLQRCALWDDVAREFLRTELAR